MDLTLKCAVCLAESSDLIKTWETDANNIKWSHKLNSCVPEVEWHEDYSLCRLCVEQLEVACCFRNLCLQSTIARKKQWKDLFREKDNHSPDYAYSNDSLECRHTGSSDEFDEESETEQHCKYCGIKFSNRGLLVLHIKADHSTDCPYSCIFCDESFKTEQELTHHEKSHSIEGSYECDLCKASYNKLSILQKHKVMKHTTPNKWKYPCQYCNTKYPFKSHRDSHILRFHNNTNDEYTCYHCSKNCPTKILLISHIRTMHSSNSRNYRKLHYIKQTRKEHNIRRAKLTKRIKQHKCSKCLKMYTTEKVMKNHYIKCDGIKRHNGAKDIQMKVEDDEKNCIKSIERKDVVASGLELQEELGFKTVKVEEIKHEGENKTPLLPSKGKALLPAKRGRKKLEQVSTTCHICGMTFNTRYLAKRHIRNVHATEKNYECDVCQQKFASPVYLNAHKRYHSRERPHICSFCGKGFITGSDLYHHEKIHANKRAYKCDKCPKAFNTSSDLHKHKLCVHQDRNDWKYVCSYCNRRFPLKTNLDAHTKTHTGERNFACHLCDRRCVNRSVLLRHIKSHSNVRLFKCNLCNTEYKYQKSLDIHMTKVHGIGDAKIPERIKKYFCHICPKSYFANNKLQKHIRTHTGERPFSCQMCEKRFIDKSYVKQHLKTAHNVIFSETDVI